MVAFISYFLQVYTFVCGFFSAFPVWVCEVGADGCSSSLEASVRVHDLVLMDLSAGQELQRYFRVGVLLVVREKRWDVRYSGSQLLSRACISWATPVDVIMAAEMDNAVG